MRRFDYMNFQITTKIYIKLSYTPCYTRCGLKVMSKDEIKIWINRWSKLKPSPQIDMVIIIWSKSLK